jgi:hypothetical protein
VSLARLLAHYETAQSSSRTLVPAEFCEELARSLRAEKITRRLYRLLPPDSIFTNATDFPQTQNFTPTDNDSLNLNSRCELPGLRFVPPDAAARRAARRADAIAAIGEYVWE